VNKCFKAVRSGSVSNLDRALHKISPLLSPSSSPRGNLGRYGPVINSLQSPNGTTLLCYAVSLDQLSVVKYILTCGADVGMLDKHGMTPLNHAIQNQNHDMVKLLIESGANPNVGGPLLRAISNIDLPMCELLVELGADVDQVDASTGFSPLHAAAQDGLESIVRFLLGCNADCTYKRDLEHETAIMKAKKNGHYTIVKMIDSHFRSKVDMPICENRVENDTLPDDGANKLPDIISEPKVTPDGSTEERISGDSNDNEGIGKGDDKYCKVCWERNRNVVILWCGHVAVCLYCSIYLQLCPICVGPIERVQKIYLS